MKNKNPSFPKKPTANQSVHAHYESMMQKGTRAACDDLQGSQGMMIILCADSEADLYQLCHCLKAPAALEGWLWGLVLCLSTSHLTGFVYNPSVEEATS